MADDKTVDTDGLLRWRRDTTAAKQEEVLKAALEIAIEHADDECPTLQDICDLFGGTVVVDAKRRYSIHFTVEAKVGMGYEISSALDGSLEDVINSYDEDIMATNQSIDVEEDTIY
jgi:hypothetical protein